MAFQANRDCLFWGDALFEKFFEIAFLVILEIYFQTCAGAVLEDMVWK
jgi:hypothetical protein